MDLADTNSSIKFNIENEVGYNELLLPNSNYIGPYTKIYTKVFNNVPPVDEADYAAMNHDIDYTLNPNKDTFNYDAKAIKTAGKKSINALLLNAGLHSKQLIDKIVGTTFNPKNENGLTTHQNAKAANALATHSQQTTGKFKVSDIYPSKKNTKRAFLRQENDEF